MTRLVCLPGLTTGGDDASPGEDRDAADSDVREGLIGDPGEAQELRGLGGQDVSLERASMKCSSRRNCDRERGRGRTHRSSRLNEAQFPKELRRWGIGFVPDGLSASMKCSSQRNCD